MHMLENYFNVLCCLVLHVSKFQIQRAEQRTLLQSKAR